MHKKVKLFFTMEGMFFPAKPLEKNREWCYHLCVRGMRARHINIPNRNIFLRRQFIMNAYLASVIENVKAKHGNDP